MKCEKHKGMVNMTPVEFPADNCPHCKVEELTNANEIYAKALTRLRDCDWVIRLPDRMDAVRDIAKEALLEAEKYKR